MLEEIIVNALPEESISETDVSNLHLRPKAIAERPALFGEHDVIKSLESVPGIKRQSDGSTFYYVRGGNRDQNMILIDDAPIYNPSHLLEYSPPSFPMPPQTLRCIKATCLHPLVGDFPLYWMWHTRKGNDQFTQVWGNVGLVSTKLGIEGPLKKESSSFLLSGRFSRLKWLSQLVDNNINKVQLS